MASLPGELKSLFESFFSLKDVNLLVIAGGGQLGDYFEGPWGYPFTICKWCLMARVRKAAVAFLSVGAGPIDSRISKVMLRSALRSANYRSFRDQSSRDLIEQLGVAGRNAVYPDLVHGVDLPIAVTLTRPKIRVVGINPLPYFDARYWAEDRADVYNRYLENLAVFAVHLIDAGYRVLLFPTQIIADPPVIDDLRRRILSISPKPLEDSLLFPRVSTFDELVNAIEATDLVVACRFHGIIVSLAAGRPVIGLSYNQKTDELMVGMGLGEYVQDIGQCSDQWLISKFQQLVTEADVVRHRIDARRSEYRDALETQYDLLFNLDRAEHGSRPAQDRASCRGVLTPPKTKLTTNLSGSSGKTRYTGRSRQNRIFHRKPLSLVMDLPGYTI